MYPVTQKPYLDEMRRAWSRPEVREEVYKLLAGRRRPWAESLGIETVDGFIAPEVAMKPGKP